MDKNMRKQAEKGQQIIRKNERYDLYTSEIAQIFADTQGQDPLTAIYTAICTSYYAGIATGKRISDRQHKAGR